MLYIFIFFFFAHSIQVWCVIPPVRAPKEVVAVENKTAEVMCSVGIPVTYCRFDIPGIPMPLSLRPGMAAHMGIKYAGAGLKKGECGFTIDSVKEKHNGVVKCYMGFENEPVEGTAQTKIVVAKPPDTPILKISVGEGPDYLREGDRLFAQCKIPNGRPAPTISWYIGGKRITTGLSKVRITESKGLFTISQNFSKIVTFADHGKDLKCKADHMALDNSSIAHSIYKIKVYFPPKPDSFEEDRYGYEIGQPGKIVVTFQANPPPDFTWMFGSTTLMPGSKDDSGRFSSSPLINKGPASWEAVLYIDSVRPEDLKVKYVINVTNELGEATYKITIHAEDEEMNPALIAAIVASILFCLLICCICIWAQRTKRWCFKGGTSKPPGESLLPRFWPFRKEKDRTPRKVNSLIYKDYVMVELEDGSKMYVSPEEKTHLLLEGKIKREKSKLFEKPKLKLKLLDSDSEEEYETPVKIKPKSCENLDTCVRPEIKRNSSFPEVFAGEHERINLPPFIMPVETSLTYPMRKKKRKEKRKTMANGDENGIMLYSEPETDADALEVRTRDPEDDAFIKNRYSLRPLSLWSRNKNSEKEKSKTRFSLPWRKPKEEEETPPENKKERKRFSVKLPKFSWSRGKKDKLGFDEPDVTNTQEEERDESGREWEYKDEPFKRRDVFKEKDVNDNEEVCVLVEEPKEIFPDIQREQLRQSSDPIGAESDSDNESGGRPEPPVWSTFPVSEPVIKEELSDTEDKIPEPPKWSTFPLAQGMKTIDRNPLADYFRSKGMSSDDDEPIRISIVEDRTKVSDNNDYYKNRNEQIYVRNFDSDSIENLVGSRPEIRSEDDLSGCSPAVKANDYLADERNKYGGLGEVGRVETASGSGSDTESADHGSADKSSVTKLTSEKQPKKLMGGIFGSFKIRKSKDKVADNDPTKNPSPFEITIKEQPEEVQIEVPRSERIVYAELDMARSQGNIMRRDDDKTEYAEIIYPVSKSPTERAMEELRKSRENIVSSRENLTEVDEAYTTVTNADGKKEAAV